MGLTTQESNWRGTLRFVVRCSVLVMAAILAWPLLPWTWTTLVVPAMSPFVTVCSAIAARSLGVAAVVGIPFLIIALVKRRWLCRYACPVGLMIEMVGWLRPSAKGQGAKLPPVGQWIALLTLAGACLGYPLLLWLDPMAMFSGFFGVFHTASSLSAIGLPIVLLFSLIGPNAWCAKLCPLGATQDLLALPQRFLRLATPPEHGKMGTDLTEGQSPFFLARRSILAMGLGAAWAAATLKFARSEAASPLRPPGAIAERRFTGVCVRCGNCVRACPSKIIQPDLGYYGVAGFLAPVVGFEKGYCLETCRRCTEVCPSGAILRLSLEQKRKTRIGLAQVNMEHCRLSDENDEKECSICVNRCPYGAITIAFDRESYTNIPRIARDKCPGCGACELACPTSPKAIRVHS